jgi:hypothetical protein
VLERGISFSALSRSIARRSAAWSMIRDSLWRLNHGLAAGSNTLAGTMLIKLEHRVLAYAGREL